jgi:hypothetical protein
MALNSTKFPNISRVISGAALLSPNDSILLCDTSSAPVTMTLLEIPSGFWQQTWKLYVLDNSNNAGTHNIVISLPSGYTINNLSTLTINTNGGGVTITIASNNSFFAQVSPLPSGGGGGSVTDVTASSPLSSSSGATPNIAITQSSAIQDGYLSATDFGIFTAKVGTATTISTTAPLSGGGDLSTNRTISIADAAADGTTKGAATFNANDFVSTSGLIGIDYTNGQYASSIAKGFLTSANWSTFDGKSEKVVVSNTAGAVVTPTCTNIEFKTTDFTTTEPVSGKALVELVQLPMMLAQETPAALPLVAPLFANTMFTEGVTQLINVVYDDGNDYDPTTGIWTCPAAGRYNLNCYAHYTLNNGSTGWFGIANAQAVVNTLVPNPLPLGGVNYTTVNTIKHGMFSVAIMSPTANSQYCGNWISATQNLKHIDITASATGMQLAAGTQLCVKVLNQTFDDYAPISGDIIRFAIQRIK